MLLVELRLPDSRLSSEEQSFLNIQDQDIIYAFSVRFFPCLTETAKQELLI